MGEMLLRAQLDPNTSRQAALLHQRRLMGKRDIESNWSGSSMSKAVVENLNENSEVSLAIRSKYLTNFARNVK